jgi:acyl-coenzyme A synthetase/AMP-(fatty) acid ligase
VLAPGAEPKLDGSSLRARLAKILPSYMCPRRVTLVSEIPLTASGKPDGPALRRALDSHCPAEHTETLG